MKKLINTIFYIIISVFLISQSTLVTYAYNTYEKRTPENNTPTKVIKVGFYDYDPYFYINTDGYPSGYYHELLNLITKELNVDFKYVNCDVNEVINALTSDEVDLLLGINITTDRLKKLIFADAQISIENFGIYTNKDLPYGSLECLSGLKFGYIENEANSEWILDFLNTRGIKLDLVSAKSYEEANKLLIDGKVDATISTINNKQLDKFKTIFKYSAGPVYIAAKKGNEDLVNAINHVFKNFGEEKPNPVSKLHDQYFNAYVEKNKNNKIIIIILFWIIVMGMFAFIYKTKIPKIHIKRKQNEIRYNLQNNQYLIYYQPIINPKTEEVKGLEALLRMKSGDKILSPYFFIKDIEEHNMMHEVSLWVLKKAIKDYNIIKYYDCMKNSNFYISINVSFKEIEDDEFVKEFTNIAKEYNVKPNTICLEIVEKIAMKNVLKMQFAISQLQKVGFLVAIDDFGVEYSNLDILEKLDCNIVKIDKYFIDDIEDSIVRKEIVKFISHLCKISNKTLVCEGVEEIEQRDLIKKIDNEKFYIQGYYYSKPLDIEDLKIFKLK